MIVRKRLRQGFTLVELLVVIAIIGVLAGLLLPAVQSARRAARRTLYTNNIKQIGIAFQQFHDVNGSLPASGYWDLSTGYKGPPNPGDDCLTTAWNFHPSHRDPSGMRYSWVLDLLPFLERGDLREQWDFSATGNDGAYWNTSSKLIPKGGNASLADTPLRILVCPEDFTTVPGRGSLSYVVNSGVAYHWLVNFWENGSPLNRLVGAGFPPEAQRRHQNNLFNLGVMFLDMHPEAGGSFVHRRHCLTRMADGTTQTILFSENINAGVENSVLWAQSGAGAGNSQSNWACPHPFNTSFFAKLVVAAPDATSNHYALINNASPASPIEYPSAKASTHGYAIPDIGGPGCLDGEEWCLRGRWINRSIDGGYEGILPFVNSGHAPGMNVAFCDGSARFMSDDVDPGVWMRLISPSGSRVVRPSDGEWQRDAMEDENAFGWTQTTVGSY